MASLILPNAAYSWWTNPLAVNHGDATYVGSVDDGEGVNRVDRMDWRTGTRTFVTLEGPHSIDEHNPAVLAIREGQAQGIAFYPRHGSDPHIRYQFFDLLSLATEPQLTVDFSSGISYAQVLQVPGTDTLHVFCRLGSTSWAYRTSTDWGQSWGDQKILIDSSELTGVLYTMLRVDSVNPGTAHMAAYLRANSATFHGIGYAAIDLATGAITSATGTSLGDLDEAAGPDLDLDNELTQAVTTADNTRIFDVGSVAGQPAVAYGLWVGAEGAPTYRVAVFNGATWTDVSVVASGEEFGHDASARYLGGMSFGGAGEDGLLRTSRQTVPEPGEWVLEEWRWGGTGYLLEEELARSTTRLIRPYSVQAPGRGRWMHQIVSTYASFTSYTSDIRLIGELVPAGGAAPGALVRTLQGSHRAMFRARVCRTFQTGEDPDGEEVELYGGDVQMGATQDIERTASVLTRGDWFHPALDRLLSPYGHEVFLERGVDLGTETLWVALGYYRIVTLGQGDAPAGLIDLDCFDRMRAIVKARLTSPRTYRSTTLVSVFFEDLVGEVFPSAVVLFDDNSGLETLGREVLVEDDRYQALRTVADGLGKIMRWNDQGIFVVETAPDPAASRWDVAAGTLGVQTSLRRQVTSEDVYNAVVATGEGGNQRQPVRAVAFDNNPASPTYFFGRFGQVPRFFSSPFLTSTAQAREAAREQLQRYLGVPYNVDFQSVPNPSLRPFDPIRVRYSDNTWERHIVDKLTIPLTEEAQMSGVTREQTLTIIGAS